MDPERAQLLKRLFAEASEKLGKDRQQYLKEQCESDPALRASVEKLLQADEASPSDFLRDKHSDLFEDKMPAQVGRFRLLRKIGEGGMGTVFEAEQDQPRRKVALKMIRGPGMSRAHLRRFEYEVQILGQLKHPGIAQIYEAGMFDDGGESVPFFAMEYVHGRPLLEFAAERTLPARERLELMCKISLAVHHAHQKGVIHRDLKPANILVDESELSEAQPKILDFGVARATRSDVQLVTMHTEIGQIIGTLSYMSPEQVAGNPDELDVRSDVYALGVILYELLAGQLPYDLKDRSISEAGNIIREHEPSRLGALDSNYRGDIETIVAKALSKEKERRYQSAAEFGDDLRRFLSNEPIVARPTSRAYQVRKFAMRNKGLVGGVAVAFVALLIGIVGVSLALLRATHAERAALRSASKANAVSMFLQNMLAGVDPEDIGPEALTVREVLDHAGTRLERELFDQPEVAASVHQTLGRHYSTLGHYDEADRHLRKAVELRKSFTTAGDDAELAKALNDLAVNLHEKREIADAEAPTREGLEMRRRLFGQESLQVAESLHDLGSILIDLGRAPEAEPLVRLSLSIRRKILGAVHADVALSTGMLGWCLMALGKFDEAETAVRDAVDMVRQLPGDHERVLAARLTFLSAVLRARDKYAEEETVVREAIKIRSHRLAQDHPALAWNLFCLARLRWKSGDFEEAERVCITALNIFTKRRGPEHEDVADCQQLLAQIYEDQRRFSEAETLWKACLEMRRNLLPPGHPDVVFAENALIKNKAAQSNVRDSLEPQ